jgi:hypothetical protein
VGIASAHEGVSIRRIAAAAGLGPTRVHAIVRDADLDGLDTALGELRLLCGWPAPEDPDGSRGEELTGRELIAERLADEVQWLRDCASWLEQHEVESPLAFPAHGRSIRQYRQALYEFEKERGRRGETDSHPLDRDIYPS